MFFGRKLGSYAGLLVPKFRSERRTEVFSLKDLANLNLGFSFVRIRTTLYPLDGLLHRSDLPQPVARDQFLGFSKRPIDYDPLFARKPDAFALRTGLQPVGCEQHSRLYQFFIELSH